ncbi:MAG: right-handed parallel beta-helix repeat-containing protein [Candidatus ainarchaeum sp.]|nr:right-handed parallel beta-helix repeat-containing protein [Candidatus ainarchaeum sp.]
MKYASVLLLLLVLTAFSFAYTNVSSCVNITSADRYVLNTSLSGAPNPVTGTDPMVPGNACIVIASSDVELDCDGYDITNDGTLGITYGIVINQTSLTNVTVRNCQVADYTIGAYASSRDASIIDNEFFTNGYGLFVQNGANTISGNAADDNTVMGFYFNYTQSMAITGNTADGNDMFGFYAEGSGADIYTDNTASNNGQVGFGVEYSGPLLFYNTTARDNTLGGFFIMSSNDTWMNGTTAHGNGAPYGGMSFIFANATVLNNTHLYDNAPDLNVSAGYGEQVLFLNTIFDNPLGNYANYTTISYYDDVIALLLVQYTMDWDIKPAEFPAGHKSFANKYVNISTVTPLMTLNYVQWEWDPSELGPNDNESEFELWEYSYASNTWTLLNDTPNTTNHVFVQSVFSPASTYAILQNENCPIINSSGTYQMVSDFTGAPNSIDSELGGMTSACVVIDSDDVVFDCNGYSITNNGTSDAVGIMVGNASVAFTNVTIDGCEVAQYNAGVSTQYADNGAISHVEAHNNTLSGFVLYHTSFFNIRDDISYNNSWHGFQLTYSEYNNLTDNNAYDNFVSGFGMYASSSYNNITNSRAFNNTYGIYITSLSLYNNVSYNQVYNNTNSGMVVSDADNAAIFDNEITMNNVYGVYTNSENTTIVGNDVNYSTDTSVYLDSAVNTIILDNIINGASNSNVYVFDSTNTNIINNWINFSGVNIMLNQSDQTFVVNNTIRPYTAAGAALMAFESNNNAFADNDITSVTGGIVVTNSTNTVSTNDSVTGSGPSSVGVGLLNATNTTFTNITIRYNARVGLGVVASNLTSVERSHFFNNDIDLQVDHENYVLPGPFIFNLTETIFDNPAGDYTNFTNLSINDSVELNSNYRITWSTNDTALPTGYASFAEKLVNITNRTAGVSIDNIVWHWTDDEVTAGGYDESAFELWKYNGTWNMLNGTPEITADTLSLSDMNPSSDYTILENRNCPVINTSITYTMANDFAGAPNDASEISPGAMACVKIAASDVIFDCDGYDITNDGTSLAYGILLNGSLTNVIVRNCGNISSYDKGIFVFESNDSIIDNVTVNSSTEFGIHIRGSSNDTIRNSEVLSTTGAGVYVSASNDTTIFNVSSHDNTGVKYGFFFELANRNNVTDSIAYNNPNGFGIQGSSDNLLTSNIARDNTRYGFSISSVTYSNFTNNTANNNSRDGFFASSSDYNNLTNNTAYNNTWSGIALSASSGNNLTGDVAYDNFQNGFYLSSSSVGNNLTDNVAHDNQGVGFQLSSSSNGNALFNNTAYINQQNGFMLDSGSDSNNLTNNTAYSNRYNGFTLQVANNNNLINNTARDSILANGFYLLVSSTGNNLTDNVAHNNLDTGFLLFSTCNDNTLFNNTAYSNSQTGFRLVSSDSNNLTNNTAYSNYNGFTLQTANNNNLINNTARDSTVLGGFYLQVGSTGNTLTGNVAHDNPSHGFSVVGSSDANNLTSNTAYSNAGTGLYVEGSQGNNATDNRAHDNQYGFGVATGATLNYFGLDLAYENVAGFHVDNADANTFVDNEAHNNTQDGFYIDVNDDYNNFTSNNAYYNDRYGFYVAFSTFNNFSVNQVYVNDQAGFFLDNADSNSFLGNEVYYNSEDGISLSASDGNTFASDQAYNNSWEGVYVLNSQNNQFSDLSSHNNTYAGVYLDTSPWNNFTDSVAYSNGWDGFRFSANSNSVRADGCTAYDNDDNGFNVDVSTSVIINDSEAYDNVNGFRMRQDSSNIIDSVAHNNAQDGFHLESSACKLMNTTARDNGLRGVYAEDSQAIVAPQAFFYNNAYDLVLNATTATPRQFNMSNGMFLNPSGTLENYTTLSINDSLQNQAYFVNWTSYTSALPTWRISFEQKFVDIAAMAGAPSLDSVVWSWTAGELVGYNENMFELWKYNGTWSGINYAPDTVAHTFTMTDMNPASIYGILADVEPDEPPDGGGDELHVSFDSTCDGNVVTVTSGGPVSGATIEVDGDPIGTTGSSGQISFEGCDMTYVTIHAEKSGYTSDYVTVDTMTCDELAACAACVDDTDCPLGYMCLEGECIPEECTPECPADYTCTAGECVCDFACCADGDCGETETCVDGACVEEFECTSDSDCDGASYCDITEGASGGSCKDVPGQCGYAANHTWVQYECGDEVGCAVCPIGKICANHVCAGEDLVCPKSGLVGDNKTCTATCTQCPYQITDPTGKKYNGISGSDGKFVLPLNTKGNYTVALVGDAGVVFKQITVEALPRAGPGEEQPPALISPEMASLCGILILLLLLILLVIYWRSKQKGHERKFSRE